VERQGFLWILRMVFPSLGILWVMMVRNYFLWLSVSQSLQATAGVGGRNGWTYETPNDDTSDKDPSSFVLPQTRGYHSSYRSFPQCPDLS
jgi:hypothetical protein